jgi:hypothetical protein
MPRERISALGESAWMVLIVADVCWVVRSIRVIRWIPSETRRSETARPSPDAAPKLM